MGPSHNQGLINVLSNFEDAACAWSHVFERTRPVLLVLMRKAVEGIALTAIDGLWCREWRRGSRRRRRAARLAAPPQGPGPPRAELLPLKLTDGTQLSLVDGHRGARADGVAAEMAIVERARRASQHDGYRPGARTPTA